MLERQFEGRHQRDVVLPQEDWVLGRLQGQEYGNVKYLYGVLANYLLINRILYVFFLAVFLQLSII